MDRKQSAEMCGINILQLARYINWKHFLIIWVELVLCYKLVGYKSNFEETGLQPNLTSLQNCAKLYPLF